MIKPVIVSAGIRRSGSTWLFNTLRLICISQTESVYTCFSNRYEPEESSAFHVVKCHEFVPDLATLGTLFFMTRRDLRDVAASAVRRQMIKEDKVNINAFLRKEINALEKWRQYATVEIAYEDMIDNKIKYTKIIADTLRIRVDPESIHEQVENLPIETTYNRITKLWPNHITDGRAGSFRFSLSVASIIAIENEFQSWLAANNYL